MFFVVVSCYVFLSSWGFVHLFKMDVIYELERGLMKPFSILLGEEGQCHGHWHNDWAMEKLFSEHEKLSEIPTLR